MNRRSFLAAAAAAVTGGALAHASVPPIKKPSRRSFYAWESISFAPQPSIAEPVFVAYHIDSDKPALICYGVCGVADAETFSREMGRHGKVVSTEVGSPTNGKFKLSYKTKDAEGVECWHVVGLKADNWFPFHRRVLKVA